MFTYLQNILWIEVLLIIIKYLLSPCNIDIRQ